MKKKPLASDDSRARRRKSSSLNGSVTYVFAPARLGERARLVIRQDAGGNVCASISGVRRLLNE